MPMDSDDHDVIRAEIDAVRAAIVSELYDTNALLLAILNQMREEKGREPMTLKDVVDGA